MFFGLTNDHTSAHIYRSVLEGVAFGIRNIVEMVENAGLTVQDVISVGGGTNNKTWVQIVSDCTGKEQQVLPAQNGAAYGAALLAGKGIGITDDPAEHTKTAEAKYRPNQHNRSVYDAAYRKYRNLYEATKLLMHDMKEE